MFLFVKGFKVEWKPLNLKNCGILEPRLKVPCVTCVSGSKGRVFSVTEQGKGKTPK